MAPHFGCALQFTMVDATNERKIGTTAPISIFSLLQQQVDDVSFHSPDKMNQSNRGLKDSEVQSPNSRTEVDYSDKASVDAPVTAPQSIVNKYFGTLMFSSANPLRTPADVEKNDTVSGETSPEQLHHARLLRLVQLAEEPGSCQSFEMTSVVDSTKVLGSFEACVRFKENYEELFLDSHPQLALQPPEEAVRI